MIAKTKKSSENCYFKQHLNHNNFQKNTRKVNKLMMICLVLYFKLKDFQIRKLLKQDVYLVILP